MRCVSSLSISISYDFVAVVVVVSSGVCLSSRLGFSSDCSCDDVSEKASTVRDREGDEAPPRPFVMISLLSYLVLFRGVQ